MKYADFEQVISAPRLGRYLRACGNNTQKAMTLYRRNLQLSQELYTIVSCFEIALRNAINQHYITTLGNDWLRDATVTGGVFDNRDCRSTAKIIRDALAKLLASGLPYKHDKIVAEMGFGFWRYLFAPNQFAAGGTTLLRIFPNKPVSTPTTQYNQALVFSELAHLNELRNRIAHHEPICFQGSADAIDTVPVRQHYASILRLFQWLGIDEKSLLYGLDHIESVCDKLDRM